MISVTHITHILKICICKGAFTVFAAIESHIDGSSKRDMRFDLE